MKSRKLTKEQIASLREIAGGADIYSRALAVRLREIQQNHPTYLTITPAAMPQEGRHRPAIGAILSRAGAEAITPKKIQRSQRQTIEARPC